LELINISDVSKRYKNGVTAIYDLDLKIKKGEFVFVIGGSGSGKSTLIKMLYREEKPTKGQIIIGGINVAKLRNSKVYKLRRRLGIVFQDYRLLPKLTVYENVAFTLEVIGTKKSEIKKRTLKAIELVGLKAKTRNYPNQLSGGEQQRVAIARAIVNNPKLLICDEPTGNLDPDMSMEIVKLLDSINKATGTTVIMATHDREIVNKMKKRVLVLKEGRLVKDYEKGKYDDEAI
jgi:cell division transport system ATP-binding protein